MNLWRMGAHLNDMRYFSLSRKRELQMQGAEIRRLQQSLQPSLSIIVPC